MVRFGSLPRTVPLFEWLLDNVLGRRTLPYSCHTSYPLEFEKHLPIIALRIDGIHVRLGLYRIDCDLECSPKFSAKCLDRSRWMYARISSALVEIRLFFVAAATFFGVLLITAGGGTTSLGSGMIGAGFSSSDEDVSGIEHAGESQPDFV